MKVSEVTQDLEVRILPERGDMGQRYLINGIYHMDITTISAVQMLSTCFYGKVQGGSWGVYILLFTCQCLVLNSDEKMSFLMMLMYAGIIGYKG